MQYTTQVFGPYLGLVLAAGVFGLAHKMGPSDVFFITLSGAYMGGIFLLYGDLTIPVALHASYDFLILCGAYLRAKRRISEEEGGIMVLEKEEKRKEEGGKKESSGGNE
jgi:membrane protease YdiL (CAAX protease family)